MRAQHFSALWLVLACSVLVAVAWVMSTALAVSAGAQPAYDRAIERAVQSAHSAPVDLLMRAVSAPGYAIPWVPLVLAVSLLLWRYRGRDEALLVGLASAGAYLGVFVLKELVRRPRPSLLEGMAAEPLWQYSFPSGHAVTYTVLFGLLGYLALARWPDGWCRWVTVAIGALAILLVGLSRVYLQAHWPSDVLAGYLIGYVWDVGSVWLYLHWRRAPE